MLLALAVAVFMAALSGVCLLCRRELRMLTKGRVRLSSWACFAVSAVFLMILLPLHFQSRLEVSHVFIAPAFSLMLLAAYIDARTAWAPDSLMLPITYLIAFPYISGFSFPVFVILSVMVFWGYITVQYGVAALRRVQSALPPGPDIMALLIGPLLLGFGLEFAISIFLVIAALLAIRSHPDKMEWVFDSAALDEAKEDLDYDGLAVPLLSILFPAYVLCAVAGLYFPQFFIM